MIVDFKSEKSASDTNQVFALVELYKLLNKAMHDCAMTQGSVGQDLAKGLDKVADLLKLINTNSANMQSEIQARTADIDSFKKWSMALGITAAVIGIAGPIAAGALAGTLSVSAVTVVEQVLTVVGILGGISAGAIQIVQGEAQLDVAKNLDTLATLNAQVSELNGHQQMYQTQDKWVMGQMSETFTRLADITKSVSNGISQMSEGMSSANEDTLRGLLGSR